MAEILEENIQRDDADIAARRQAVVLSLWEEVCDAFNHGWSYKEIWKGLEREGIVDFGYWSFMHYIRKIRQRLVYAEKGITPPAARRKTDANRNTTLKPATPSPSVASGSTRLDVPNFGQGVPSRDPKKF